MNNKKDINNGLLNQYDQSNQREHLQEIIHMMALRAVNAYVTRIIVIVYLTTY